jgi:hypothetical protein
MLKLLCVGIIYLGVLLSHMHMLSNDFICCFVNMFKLSILKLIKLIPQACLNFWVLAQSL